ncbi:hypothetical protein C8R43DRAFT_1193315 [Mycena crocata]|nr:hypothetical protein C8R43DRAFT_1193315 [Mycena crocata]
MQPAQQWKWLRSNAPVFSRASRRRSRRETFTRLEMRGWSMMQICSVGGPHPPTALWAVQKSGVRCETGWLFDSFGLAGTNKHALRAAARAHGALYRAFVSLPYFCDLLTQHAARSTRSSTTRRRAARGGTAELEGGVVFGGLEDGRDAVLKEYGADLMPVIPPRDVHITRVHQEGEWKGKGYIYPKKTLDMRWEKVLLIPSHDVLPGSTIGMVYDDAKALYAEVHKDGCTMFEEAVDVILGGSSAVSSTSASSAVVAQIAQIPANGTKDVVRETGHVVAHCAGGAHAAGDGGVGGLCLFLSIPEQQRLLRPPERECAADSIRGADYEFRGVQLKRELIQEGATEVEIHLEKPTQLAFTNVFVAAQGPPSAMRVRGSSIGSSSMFRFDVHVYWQQQHNLLKFKPPLDINSENAKYETQFGHIQHPTRKNTMWDMAKFEVCGYKAKHKHCLLIPKSGHQHALCSVPTSANTATALCSSPSPSTGEHISSWAVMLHKGHFLKSNAPMAAYLFNSCLYPRTLPHGASARTLNAAMSHPFAVVNSPNVFLETVKHGGLP